MPTIDVSFPMIGQELPADCGYFLYGAISTLVPALHNLQNDQDPARAALWKRMRIHPIHGRLTGDRKMALTPGSRLVIRCDHELLPEILVLAGKSIIIGRHSVRLTVPQPALLRPAPVLRSRLVVIKGFTDSAKFLDAVRYHVDKLGVQGVAELPRRSGEKSFEDGVGARTDQDNWLRRTLTVDGRAIVGYAVRIRGLSEVDSIRLQEAGIGGKGHFGCGVFVPETDAEE